MAVETFDAFCPTCNMQVVTRVIAQGHGGFSSAAMNAIDEADAEYHGDQFFVALCTKCTSPFLVKQSLYGIPGEFESITQENILFPVESRLLLEGIPEFVKRAYEQALRSYSASLYESSALMCRRCLEAIAKSLGAQGRNLQDKLDSLKTTGHVDSKLVEWAHSIRILGNEAAHDTDEAITKDDAKDVLDFTEALLLYVFLLNQRFAAFQCRRASDASE